jgi:hypothetical protein
LWDCISLIQHEKITSIQRKLQDVAIRDNLCLFWKETRVYLIIEAVWYWDVRCCNVVFEHEIAGLVRSVLLLSEYFQYILRDIVLKTYFTILKESYSRRLLGNFLYRLTSLYQTYYLYWIYEKIWVIFINLLLLWLEWPC